MISSVVLGSRIKFFRKNRGLSQLELESAIDASPGMVSRIENAHVNPTKETMMRIKEILKLNNLEFDYLVGDIANPVSSDDVESVRASIWDFMVKRFTLAYMVDERSRVWMVSDSFFRLMNLDSHKSRDIYGKTLTELILDPSYGIRQFLETENFDMTLRGLFNRMYPEIYFMVDDPFYKENLAVIESDPLAKRIWHEVASSFDTKVHTNETKLVSVKINKFKFMLRYSVENLILDDRFRIVEYIPNNIVLRILKKLG